MRIVSLTLQGFKSFGDRATIEFAPGVTGIIGPNGSGKSNVIDALRWTTGGGRAREFRAEDKTDLIFHGATGKRSVGLAEVEIELHDGANSLKLYRSLDRDGVTRLRLNGRNARFLDVEEALAGSGLGRSGLAVIGQGEVSQVLMADPARLLEYVAEAAGAARLSTRRDQTQDRLDTAGSHLDRLQDVLTELEARANALTAEAHDAQRHEALTTEGLRLRFTAAVARQATLLSDITALERSRGDLEGRLAEGRLELAEARSSLDKARTERELSQERLRVAASELEVRRGDVRVAQERQQQLAARRLALGQQQHALENERQRLAGSKAPVAPDRSLEDARAAVAELETEAVAARSALDVARKSAEAATAEFEEQRRRRTAHDMAVAAYRSRVTSLEEQQAGLTARLAELAAGSTDDPQASLDALELKAGTATDARTAASIALEHARQELEKVHRVQAMAAAEAMSSQRAMERQRAAFESRRGYAQGPRNALASGVAGVIGSVADLVRVPSQYQQAVSGALGRRAEYVVVDTAETAEKVLAKVKETGGFATVLPLDLLRPGGHAVPAGVASLPGVVAPATDVVETEPRFTTVIDMLLGGTVIVQDMRAASAIARRQGARPRMVTLDGDLLETSGAMSGGKRSQQSAVLGAAAELEDAEAAAADAQDHAAVALADLEVAQQRVRDAQAASRSAVEHAELATASLARARERTNVDQRVRTDLEARLAEVVAERMALEAPSDPVLSADGGTDTLEQARSRSSTAHEALDAARLADAAANGAATTARHELALLEERWSAHRAGTLRHEQARTRLGELDGELQVITERSTALQSEIAVAEERLAAATAALPTGLDTEEAASEAARVTVVRREADVAARSEAQAQLAMEIEESKVQAARRETTLELADEELRGFPDGVVRLDMSERAARTRLREVTEALEGIGPVNHRAAGELEEVKTRKETLEVEAVQATLAVAELQAALER
ncbi:MAG TPA: chromosome segregation SMC family protein, partial [Trueperaceae bacterium]|nr:chromosome segregation SMC family protein [Trueperaceae bacterium]